MKKMLPKTTRNANMYFLLLFSIVKTVKLDEKPKIKKTSGISETKHYNIIVTKTLFGVKNR